VDAITPRPAVEPITTRRSTLTTAYVVRDKNGGQTLIQLFSKDFVRLTREWQPKVSNPAEWEEFVTIEYKTDCFKIRGNREALDRLVLSETSGELGLVQLSEGADPDQAENSRRPVVYSLELVPKPSPGRKGVPLAATVPPPAAAKRPYGQLFDPGNPPIQLRRPARKTNFVLTDKFGVPTLIQVGFHDCVKLIRQQPMAAGREGIVTIQFPTESFVIRGNREALNRIVQSHASGELSLIQASEGANPDQAENLRAPVVYKLDLVPKPAPGGKGGEVSDEMPQPKDEKRKGVGQK